MNAPLTAQVETFLRARGASTSKEIAIGIRARRADVDRVLAGAAFRRVPTLGGCSPRATYFNVSYLVPSRPARQESRAARMLRVLRDGRPHSRQEIFETVGFMLTNNAASELRTRGHQISQRRERGIYIYQLLSPQALSEQDEPADGPPSPSETPGPRVLLAERPNGEAA